MTRNRYIYGIRMGNQFSQNSVKKWFGWKVCSDVNVQNDEKWWKFVIPWKKKFGSSSDLMLLPLFGPNEWMRSIVFQFSKKLMPIQFSSINLSYTFFCFVYTSNQNWIKKIKFFQTGYSYGFGFINYVNEEAATRAIKCLNGYTVRNKRLKVSYARPAGDNLKETNLYITNLPRNITEEWMETIFGKYGTIVQKSILRDKLSNQPKGVAFVR